MSARAVFTREHTRKSEQHIEKNAAQNRYFIVAKLQEEDD
jgi:hypothetical protein